MIAAILVSVVLAGVGAAGGVGQTLPVDRGLSVVRRPVLPTRWAVSR